GARGGWWWRCGWQISSPPPPADRRAPSRLQRGCPVEHDDDGLLRIGRCARWETLNQELLSVLRDGEREIPRRMRGSRNDRPEQPPRPARLERRSGGRDLDSHQIRAVHEEQLTTVAAPPRSVAASVRNRLFALNP